MNMVEFQWLRSALESLGNSTDVVLWYEGLTARLSRRRSAYRSHQEVTFEASPHPERGILRVRNDRYGLAVRMEGAGGIPAETLETLVEWHQDRSEHLIDASPADGGEPWRELTEYRAVEADVPAVLLAAVLEPAREYLRAVPHAGRHAPPPTICRVAWAMPVVNRYEADAEGVMRPVYAKLQRRTMHCQEQPDGSWLMATKADAEPSYVYHPSDGTFEEVKDVEQERFDWPTAEDWQEVK